MILAISCKTAFHLGLYFEKYEPEVQHFKLVCIIFLCVQQLGIIMPAAVNMEENYDKILEQCEAQELEVSLAVCAFIDVLD